MPDRHLYFFINYGQAALLCQDNQFIRLRHLLGAVAQSHPLCGDPATKSMNFGILYRPITGFFVSLRRIKTSK